MRKKKEEKRYSVEYIASRQKTGLTTERFFSLEGALLYAYAHRYQNPLIFRDIEGEIPSDRHGASCTGREYLNPEREYLNPDPNGLFDDTLSKRMWYPEYEDATR